MTGPAEKGSAGVEVVAVGVLVFVVGALVVATGWRVVDVKFAAAAAAREGVRAFVEAPPGGDARSEAETAAVATLEAYGVAGDTDRRIRVDGVLERCARVRVTVELAVAPDRLPWLTGRAPTPVGADHSELVDPLRSGLPGEATCVGG